MKRTLKSQTVVFIDASVDNYEQLLYGVIPTAQAYLVNSNSDGVEQISWVLAEYPNVGEVHIISHGSPGCLYLGNGQLSLDTLNSYASQLQQWNIQSLLLYGCYVAVGDAGTEFVEKLHDLMGTDIAASKSLTGSAIKGGNWDLELFLGEKQPLLALNSSTIKSYEGILATTDWTQPDQFIFGWSENNGVHLNITFSDGSSLSRLITDQGWVIRDASGSSFYDNSNPNFFAGFNQVYAGWEGRNYFLFDINAFAGKTVINARINFPSTFWVQTPGTQESYELFDFNESFYQNGGLVGPAQPIHDDLMDGQQYSANPYIFGTNSDYQSFSLNLSSAAISDLNQAIANNNNLFGIGGAVTSLSGLIVKRNPIGLSLSNIKINENVVSNSIVGTFSTSDPDSINNFTYSLVSGIGSSDNNAFFIVNNQLTIKASPDFETKDKYTIRVRTTDQGGLFYEKDFMIGINDVNEVPTGLTLDRNSIDENSPDNSVIGEFSATDPDSDTVTYSLVDGEVDNSAFEIVDGKLQIKSSANYEAKSSYEVLVKASDPDGLSEEKQFTININDVNEAPEGLSLDGNSIDENSADNSVIGEFSATDPDGDAITYSLVDGAGNNTAFEIVDGKLQIKSFADYEAKPSYDIVVKATDPEGLFEEKQFTININDVNEAPEGLTLDGNSIDENSADNSVIGEFSANDPDGDIVTYSLVEGAGDNTAFEIVDGKLQIKSSADYEAKPSYEILVKASDPEGLSEEKQFTININDVNEAPEELSLDGNSVDENSADNSVIGEFSATDPDGDTVTYSLVDGEADNTAFEIIEGKLQIKSSADYEAKSSYEILVKTSDPDGLFEEKQFTININDVNEAPEGLTLDGNSIDENSADNLVIGEFSATDPDGDAITYSLVDGAGDNTAFEIVEGKLQIKSSADYEAKPSYEVLVKASDPDGLSEEKQFTININDVNEKPSATGETVSTGKNTKITVELGDNISDPDNNGLTGAILQVKNSTNGTVASTDIDQDALNISFTPTTGFVGTASFEYTISDAGGMESNTATVTIEVGDILNGGNKSQDSRGNAGNDYISSGNAKDKIQGFGGHDTLLGNNGADTIDGGNGNDRIDGGNGPDLLTGGAGRDTFILAKNAGGDTITDFNITDITGDLIKLVDNLTFDTGNSATDIKQTQSGSNILLYSPTDTLLATLQNVSEPLTSVNFV